MLVYEAESQIAEGFRAFSEPPAPMRLEPRGIPIARSATRRRLSRSPTRRWLRVSVPGRAFPDGDTFFPSIPGRSALRFVMPCCSRRFEAMPADAKLYRSSIPATFPNRHCSEPSEI